MSRLPRYIPERSYEWNYRHPPRQLPEVECPDVPGQWTFCGLPVDSPLGIAAGPLLNGAWCRYYAALGFDVVTYKTVRSIARPCYGLPNLQPVGCGRLQGGEGEVPAAETMEDSWAVSFGMPSKTPDVWQRDVWQTRRALPARQKLAVSVVGSVQPGWSIEELADDYATCAKWAADSGADCVETNFSCPNVSTCDGQLYQQPDAAAQVARCTREALGSAAYLIKIGFLDDRAAEDRLVEAVGPFADALVMTNSIASRVRGASGQWMFEGEPRGICGRAIRDASLRQVERFRDRIERQRLALRIVGVGGIENAEDVRAYLDAGAEAVQLATAAMLHPEVGLEIRRDLAAAVV